MGNIPLFHNFILTSSSCKYHDQTYHNIIKIIVDKGIVFFVNNNIYYGKINDFFIKG